MAESSRIRLRAPQRRRTQGLLTVEPAQIALQASLDGCEVILPLREEPLVSVVMSVFNGEQYVRSAIDSILSQTHSNLEFIIIDDGSSDATLSILKQYVDPRVRLISRPNRGLANSLNEGIAIARGKYIARQDADDISKPERLSLQISYLERRHDIGLLGCNYSAIDNDDQPLYSTESLTHPDDLKLAEFVLLNQLCHGSVLFRRCVFDRVGPYDPTARFNEDFDLWIRFNRVCGIANLAEPLYLWRRNPNGISLLHAEEQLQFATRLREREFENFAPDPGQYHVWSYHPLSFPQGFSRYHERKSTIYRTVAGLYAARGQRFRSAGFLVVATVILAPWPKRFYRCLSEVLVPELRTLWRFS